MIRPLNLLQVGTHATLRPIHGGQLRSHNIGRVLEAAGHSVRGIATCYRQEHDIANGREAILDIARSNIWRDPIGEGVAVDYLFSRAVEENSKLRDEFFRLAEAARPDVVLLEHPWMWPLVRLIPEVANGSAKVIYNSQNVEAHLKRKIVQTLELTPAELSKTETILQTVDSFEREVVNSVDAVTACTAEDAGVFISWGAKRTVLAGNGASRQQVTGLNHPLPEQLPKNCRYAFVIGSKHPPNVTGFETFVLPWLAKLWPGQRVVVAGGVSDWLRERLAEQGLFNALEGRLVLLGRINDLALSALIENAACIMLPIEYGGGSNIKTAEALLSDRRIVASPQSMRGFNEYQNLPGVTVADGPETFATAVLSALRDETPTQRSPSSVAALTWDAMLAPLVALVNEIGSTN